MDGEARRGRDPINPKGSEPAKQRTAQRAASTPALPRQAHFFRSRGPSSLPSSLSSALLSEDDSPKARGLW